MEVYKFIVAHSSGKVKETSVGGRCMALSDTSILSGERKRHQSAMPARVGKRKQGKDRTPDTSAPLPGSQVISNNVYMN